MTRGNRLGRVGAAVLVAVLVGAGAACGTTGDTESSGAPATSGEPSGESVAGDVSTTAAGTGGSGADSTTTGPREDAAEPAEACDLLTRDDAEDVFGEPVDPGEDRSDECWWSTEADLKVVNLRIRRPDLDEWRAGKQNDSWEEVDLGDEGYRGVGIFDTVELRVGETVYELNVTYSTSGDPEAAVEELAERVASRL